MSIENIRLGINYAEWAIIVLLTIASFSYFSKKYKTFGKLLPSVLIPVWILIAIIKGVENMYFDNSSELLSLGGYTYLLAETLFMLLLFGGITFSIKYNRFRKTNK